MSKQMLPSILTGSRELLLPTRTLREHTYQMRMKELLEILNMHLPK